MSSVIKKNNVQLASTGLTTGVRHPTAKAATCTNRVRVLRVADVVEALEITCTCGETTLVELSYPQAEARDGHA